LFRSRPSAAHSLCRLYPGFSCPAGPRLKLQRWVTVRSSDGKARKNQLTNGYFRGRKRFSSQSLATFVSKRFATRNTRNFGSDVWNLIAIHRHFLKTPCSFKHFPYFIRTLLSSFLFFCNLGSRKFVERSLWFEELIYKHHKSHFGKGQIET